MIVNNILFVEVKRVFVPASVLLNTFWVLVIKLLSTKSFSFVTTHSVYSCSSWKYKQPTTAWHRFVVSGTGQTSSCITACLTEGCYWHPEARDIILLCSKHAQKHLAQDRKVIIVAVTLSSHNLPTDRAGELFKPSTDLASLLVYISKKFRLGLKFLWLTSQWVMVLPFWPSSPGPGRQPNKTFFGSSFFLETRLRSESLEPLIVFLAYLEPKWWLKNSIFDKNTKVPRKV